MKDQSAPDQPHSPNPDMQPPPQWEPPAILLERSLVIHGQQGIGGMGDTPLGWIGPLSASGGGGMGGGVCN